MHVFPTYLRHKTSVFREYLRSKTGVFREYLQRITTWKTHIMGVHWRRKTGAFAY